MSGRKMAVSWRGGCGCGSTAIAFFPSAVATASELMMLKRSEVVMMLIAQNEFIRSSWLKVPPDSMLCRRLHKASRVLLGRASQRTDNYSMHAVLFIICYTIYTMQDRSINSNDAVVRTLASPKSVLLMACSFMLGAWTSMALHTSMHS